MKLVFSLSLVFSALALFPAAAPAEVAEGQPAPRLSMKLLKNGSVSDFPGWQAYKGKVVVLELWGTWCAPCVANIPRLNSLQEALRGKPVEFISVTEESADAIAKFLKTHPMSGSVAVDGGQALKAIGTGLFPQTVLISKTGTVLRYTQPEELNEKALLQVLETGSAAAIRKVLPVKEETKKRDNPPLFEVQVSSVPEDARLGYGRGTNGTHVTLDYRALGLAQLLAKVYEVAPTAVEISSAVPQRKYKFVVRVPKEAEAAAKPLLKEAIKAAYGAEVLVVKKEKEALLLRYDNNAAHEGFSPAPESGSRSDGDGKFNGHGVRVANLAEVLSRNMGLPVVDETGLDGTYDMELQWTAGDKESLKAVLGQRFGMTLTPATRELEALEVFPAAGR